MTMKKFCLRFGKAAGVAFAILAVTYACLGEWLPALEMFGFGLLFYGTFTSLAYAFGPRALP
jgi:hypothetical protein